MADVPDIARFKIADTDEPKEAGYDEWKHAKILRAFEESQDRTKMIPAEEVWRRLGLED